MSISILVAADYCPNDRVAKLIDEGQYEIIFGEVKPIIESCDYSIVNFECPVRTTSGNGIKKAGPSLKCSSKAVEALTYAGFKCATLANNHFYDQGENGVKETISELDRAGIAHVGGGFNLVNARDILYQKVKDKTIAIINCCEHEWSIATDTTGGSNPLNSIQQYYDIKEARSKADYVIVIVHGGIEHFQYPSPRMIDTYRYFIDVGADAVINHHQHCFSGGENYKGKPIFYGLGNFCFDWQDRRNKLWDEGFMVKLIFEDDRVSYNMIPYSQNDETLGVHLMNEDKIVEWQKQYDSISNIISNSEKLNKTYSSFLKRTNKFLRIYVTPYTSKFTLALFMRKLLPRIMPQKKLRVLYNMLLCESHYDRMMYMFRKEIENN